MRFGPPPGCWMQAPARGTASATALTPAMYTLNEEGMLPGTVSSITPVVWSSNSSLTPCGFQHIPRRFRHHSQHTPFFASIKVGWGDRWSMGHAIRLHCMTRNAHT